MGVTELIRRIREEGKKAAKAAEEQQRAIEELKRTEPERAKQLLARSGARGVLDDLNRGELSGRGRIVSQNGMAEETTSEGDIKQYVNTWEFAYSLVAIRWGRNTLCDNVITVGAAPDTLSVSRAVLSPDQVLDFESSGISFLINSSGSISPLVLQGKTKWDIRSMVEKYVAEEYLILVPGK